MVHEGFNTKCLIFRMTERDGGVKRSLKAVKVTGDQTGEIEKFKSQVKCEFYTQGGPRLV